MRGVWPVKLALLAGCTVEAVVGVEAEPPPAPSPAPVETEVLCRPALVDFGDVAPGRVHREVARCRGRVTRGGAELDPADLRITDAVMLEGSDRDFTFGFRVAGARVEPPFNLGPTGALEVEVEVSSQASAQLQSTLRIYPERGDALDLVARAHTDPNAACALEAEPLVVDFGASPVGAMSRSHLRLRNLGTSTCGLEGWSFLPGSAPDFGISDAGPLRLPPRAPRFLSLSFAPAAEPGRRQGLLALEGDRGVLLRAVPVRGLAQAPEGAVEVSPRHLDFGRRGGACVNPTRQSVRVTAGGAPVEVRARLTPASSPSFGVAPVEARLEPGETLPIPVEMVPRAEGPQRGRLELRFDAQETAYVSLEAEVGADSVHRQRFVGPPPYMLAGRPTPGSAEVWLDGQPLPRTRGGRVVWALDFTVPRLILAEPPSAPSAEVEIRYEQVCTPATCGDGVVDPLEACDDGNADPRDACLPGCLLAHCGDGFVREDGSEECDDGNTFSGDGCNAVCLLERCGNGIIEGDEECDSGEGLSDVLPDACRTTCTRPFCGDEVVDSGEACDDGNGLDDDACVACRHAVCGDGHVHAGVEACDDGNQVDGDGCEADCTLPVFAHSVAGVEQFPGRPVGVPIAVDQPLPIPFPFRFLGRSASHVDASQPGLLVFDGSPPSARNTSLPASGGPSGFIAWWWDDLELAGPAFAWVAGLPGHRVFALRFDAVKLGAGPDAVLAVEVRLHEQTGAVVVHYGPLVGSANVGSASVGWEAAESDRGADVLGCAPSCELSSWPAREIHVYRP